MIVRSPLYLLHATMSCWHCGKDLPVIALTGVVLAEGDHKEEESLANLAILEYITEMPNALAELINTTSPHYALNFSDKADFAYYANICGHCGTMSGDNYVMGIDGPFAFHEEKPRKAISYQLLPLEGNLSIECNASWGMAEQLIREGNPVIRA